MNIDINSGLSSAQAAEKAANGENNGSFDIKTKSAGRIFKDNIFTLFNLINVILASLVAFVGSYRNMLFMGVVLSNTAIGIFQEIRSKRVIDKLSLLSAPRAHLIRDGNETELPVSDIVKEDIMLLSAGRQVCADGIVLEGECEADESLVTGESDPVPKKSGDELLSGSFIVSGSVKAQAVRVGAESFSGRITSGAKSSKKRSSKMMKSINRLISVVSVCILPFGIVLFYKALNITGQNFSEGVTSTVAALIGMIPEGLMLLTSIALAVSSIRLAAKQTLCQDLYCVESLARVDVVCLDKTGTITEGCMEVTELIPIDSRFDIEKALCAAAACESGPNPTLKAIAAKYSELTDLKAVKIVPFSSARKWSGVEFKDYGTLILGAPDFVLEKSALAAIAPAVKQYSEKGMRVLLLAFSPEDLSGAALPKKLSPKALVILSDKIRKSAPQTLEYFKRQGVTIKVISGDDPVTVYNVAKKAGLSGEYIDASRIPDELLAEAAEKYAVFGRVTPSRKLELIKALKGNGHTVAMTGDGVNDVLALKEADCSVAMQSGSDAARSVSQLVLLNSDFASMPLAVEEGRRSINNIERSAALFLVKTIFAFLLAVLFLILPFAYPFRPIQMTLISGITIGIPSFLLALEPNHNLIRGSFLSNVLKKSAPGGITVALGIGALMILQYVFELPQESTSTIATLLTACVSFAVLFGICRPFNKRRGVMFIALIGLFAGAALLFPTLFYLVPLSVTEFLLLLALVGGAWLCLFGLNKLAKLMDKK
ncbi:MAG: HAD-IC family P-type ATPase [Oscillospiraceae bacterium]|nr:HAD-IC family P-type ATPase [Oscillospiraceae bacterium]